MNRAGIALAADSAGTVEFRGQPKISNYSNKLFALSKYNPVALMVSGSLGFMGIPWETVVKQYRVQLGRTSYASVLDYADGFVRYVESLRDSGDAAELRTVREITVTNLVNLDRDIRENVNLVAASSKTLSVRRIRGVIESTIDDWLADWGAAPDWQPSQRWLSGARRSYADVFDESIEGVLGRTPLRSSYYQKAKRLCLLFLSKDRFSDRSSTIAIAGFGDAELFPSLVHLDIEGIIHKRFKVKRVKGVIINDDNTASIVPFAQRDMVATFMEGVDPRYQALMDGTVKEVFDGLPEVVVSGVAGQLLAGGRHVLEAQMTQTLNEALERIEKKLAEYRAHSFVGEILDVVATLPKEELVQMAETLVSLTSFRRRMSMDPETVGGPVDVALLSKGDGLIWIRRKHYFDSNLNPYYMARYYTDRGR